MKRRLPVLALFLARLATPAQDISVGEGVITGRLLDGTARPMPGIRARARIVRNTEGRPVLSEVDPAVVNTDDRGEYRLFGLPAGEYYLSILVVRDSQAMSFYYPGTQDLADAEPIRLNKDSEFRAADFRLPSLLRSRAKITGIIDSEIDLHQPVSPGPTARWPDRETYLEFMKAYSASVAALIPRDKKRVMETSAFAIQFQNTASDRNLNFQLENVPSGSYDLVLVDRSANVQSEPIAIDVRNKDLLDMTVRIRRAEVTGQVSQKGNVPATPLAGITIELLPSHRFYTLPPTTADGAGRFILPNLSSGLYALALSGLPRDASVAEVRVGGHSVEPVEFLLPQGKQQLEIVVDRSSARN